MYHQCYTRAAGVTLVLSIDTIRLLWCANSDLEGVEHCLLGPVVGLVAHDDYLSWASSSLYHTATADHRQYLCTCDNDHRQSLSLKKLVSVLFKYV